ncbi:MAG: UrcA family protein [Halieaceae bacterium]|nr:UrcA family protein [Halieaceae bacterium]
MQIRTTRNTVIAAAAFTILSGLSAVSTANLPEISIQSLPVNYADLNLNQAEDAQTLYTRLRRTAEIVCEDTRRKSLQEMNDQRECREFAIDQAVREVGNDTLSQIHQS